jgi:hypothetical protein
MRGSQHTAALVLMLAAVLLRSAQAQRIHVSASQTCAITSDTGDLSCFKTGRFERARPAPPRAAVASR